jgi:hypothetical protein
MYFSEGPNFLLVWGQTFASGGQNIARGVENCYFLKQEKRVICYYLSDLKVLRLKFGHQLILS